MPHSRDQCEDDEENQNAVGEERAIGAVVAVLRRQGSSDGLLLQACGALGIMCCNAENVQAAGKEGAIGAEVAVLRRQGACDVLLEMTCEALRIMCCSVEENKKKAVRAGCAKVLMAVQQRASASDDLRKAARDALSRLSKLNGAGL